MAPAGQPHASADVALARGGAVWVAGSDAGEREHGADLACRVETGLGAHHSLRPGGAGAGGGLSKGGLCIDRSTGLLPRAEPSPPRWADGGGAHPSPPPPAPSPKPYLDRGGLAASARAPAAGAEEDEALVPRQTPLVVGALGGFDPGNSSIAPAGSARRRALRPARSSSARIAQVDEDHVPRAPNGRAMASLGQRASRPTAFSPRPAGRLCSPFVDGLGHGLAFASFLGIGGRAKVADPPPPACGPRKRRGAAPPNGGSKGSRRWMGDVQGFSTLDVVALGPSSFLAAWSGAIHPGTARWRSSGRPRRSLNKKTPPAWRSSRRAWLCARTLVRRRTESVDSTPPSCALAFQSGAAFFASTSLLAVGASLALIQATDTALALFADLPFGVAATRLAFEAKVFGLGVIFVYAFFKFAWSYRLFQLCCDPARRRPAGRGRAAGA